ncbi:recombinase family protein [Bradyrhizobium sp. CCBAU 51627]|uniref:recombinase family protein n=1 Tax=Bradyrhizobium sp. CCBAU 51627 TaxID=1325088 RepID=UPI002304F911|nr:recombinase family protein [Bradyrhizobium sp. CCBAU 51627]
MANALDIYKAHPARSQLDQRAAQYVRMSTQRQQYSIQNQAAVIAAYAHAHSLTIVRTYRDVGESGLLIKNRTGLIQLIKDVQTGEADFGHILVYDVSRWGRFQDVDESAYYEFVCKQAGINIVYCAEQFDNDGSLLSSIIKNIKRVMAAEYSRELSTKVHAAQCRFARLGFKLGGRPGYALLRELVDHSQQSRGVLKNGDQKYLATDHVRLRPGIPAEVAVVKWIFERFLQVKSEATIAGELNRKEILTSTRRRWSRAAVNTVLRNENYIGNLTFNRRSRKLRRKSTCNPPELWITSEGCIEPIIERDTFLKAKKIIEERRVDLNEEEMLARLRKTLVKEGRLSSAIIASTVGLPCASTYQTHFGSMMNVYRLIGYTPKRNYEFLESRPLWAEQKAKLGSQIATVIKKAGGRTVSRAGYLRVNGSVNISIRVALWCGRQDRAPYWCIKREARLPHGWIAAARMAEHNKSVLDYVLLRTGQKVKRTMTFSERARIRRGIARFETANGLARGIVERAVEADRSSLVSSGNLSKPKQPATKTPHAQR